jgi:hypothetical protein
MKQLLFGTLALASVPLVGLGQTFTNSGVTVTVPTNASLYIDGNLRNNAGSTVSLGGELTVTRDFTNAGSCTTASTTNNDVLYVYGNVQNLAGGTLTSSGLLRFDGDFTNAGAFTNTYLLFLNSSQDQTFTPGTASRVDRLYVNNGGAPGDNRLFIAGDLAITYELYLLSGMVRTQGRAVGSPLYTLSVLNGGFAHGEGPGQYVQGRLAVTRNNVGGTTDFVNGLIINPNSQNLGTVTVTRTAGLRAAGLSYGQNLNGTTKGIDRVWQVVASQQPSAARPVTATASWLPDDDNGLNLNTPVQLWRANQASGPWVAQGTPGSAGSRSLSASVAQLGALTLSNISQPLPVTLVAFTAGRLGADGLLKWTTASELRNDYFEVESSVDGVTFRPLGRVAGVGTSAQAHSYQFTDAQIARYATALVYYRLHQVDTDGTSTYSPVRTVAVPLEAGLLVQAYPNPSAPGAAVALSIRTGQAGPATLRLTDVLGRELSQQQADLPAGVTILPLPATSQLATGVYLLRVQQGGQQQALRLVLE